MSEKKCRGEKGGGSWWTLFFESNLGKNRKPLSFPKVFGEWVPEDQNVFCAPKINDVKKSPNRKQHSHAVCLFTKGPLREAGV